MKDEEREEPGEVLSARFGRSANCSSVGSVVDLLFVSSVVGTALLGALAVTVRGASDDAHEDEPAPGSQDEDSPDEG